MLMASTLERRIYWESRDLLESGIASRSASIAHTLPSDSNAVGFLPEWRNEITVLRERLVKLGDPPGPRVRSNDEQRDRYRAAALTGLLAARAQGGGSFEECANDAAKIADAMLALDDEEG